MINYQGQAIQVDGNITRTCVTCAEPGRLNVEERDRCVVGLLVISEARFSDLENQTICEVFEGGEYIWEEYFIPDVAMTQIENPGNTLAYGFAVTDHQSREGVFAVQFKNGLYHYQKVPLALYEEAVATGKGLGSFIQTRIKGTYRAIKIEAKK